MKMTLKTALEIVLELAAQNALNPDEVDRELVPEARRQTQALNQVEKLLDIIKR